MVVACSEEPDQPKRVEEYAESRRPVAEDTLAPGEGAATTSVKSETGVAIEAAVLMPSEEGHEIHVWARFSGPESRPECSVLDGPTWKAAQRAMKSGHPSRALKKIERYWWEDPGFIETSTWLDAELIVVFREHRNPPAEAPDPRRTPLFAVCRAGDSLWGPQDATHVEGTPVASS
jgi:hypothetical protein